MRDRHWSADGRVGVQMKHVFHTTFGYYLGQFLGYTPSGDVITDTTVIEPRHVRFSNEP